MPLKGCSAVFSTSGADLQCSLQLVGPPLYRPTCNGLTLFGSLFSQFNFLCVLTTTLLIDCSTIDQNIIYQLNRFPI